MHNTAANTAGNPPGKPPANSPANPPANSPGKPPALLPRAAVRANRLLAVLPLDALDRLLQDAEKVWLVSGDVLYSAERALTHAYFPVDIIVTLLLESGGRPTTKVAMVGREGVVGVSAFMGGAPPPGRAVVLNSGNAFKIPAAALKAEFDRNGVAMRLLLRFTQSMVTQMAQSAVCNRHHQIEPQLCSWLLASMDRLPNGNTLPVTQETVASMLGVRREGIGLAAGALRQLGLIDFRRGRINVLDRPGLLARACECYGVVKRETDRLLPDRPAT